MLAGLMLAGCQSATGTAEPVEVTEEQKQEIQENVQQAVSQVDSILAEGSKLSDLAGIKILAPSGAPALATIPASIVGNTVEFVDGADPLQAALVNPEPQYDIIIAPSNLGMKLAEAGKTTYRLYGIVTWGNLYVVGEKGTAADPSTWTNVASFGEQSVTGKVFQEVYKDAINMDEVTWYNSTAEASAALLAGDASVAMLAEPNATAILAKAKEAGKELEIIADIQEAYAGGNGKGFPQAAVFVNEQFYTDHQTQIDELFGFMSKVTGEMQNLTPEDITGLVNTFGGAEKFGVPSAEIVGKVWSRLNINLAKAEDHIDELKKFGEMFGIADVESTLAK